MDKNTVVEINDCLNDALISGEKNIRRTDDDALKLHMSVPNAFIKVDGNSEEVIQIIKEWACTNQINLYEISPSGDEFAFKYTTESSSDSPATIYLPNEIIESINTSKTVLLIKDIDKMKDKRYRRYLLDFCNSHCVLTDETAKKSVLLKNVLFTVATVNPMTGGGFFELNTMDAKDWMIVDTVSRE